MTTANPPAGWYEDPEYASKLRWWDGSAWTEQRADVPPTPSEAPPADPAPVADAAHPDNGRHEPSSENGESREGDAAPADDVPLLDDVLAGRSPVGVASVATPERVAAPQPKPVSLRDAVRARGAVRSSTTGTRSGAVRPPDATGASERRASEPAAATGVLTAQRDPAPKSTTGALATPGERLAAVLLDGVVGMAAYVVLFIVTVVLGVLPDGLAAVLGLLLMIATWVLLFVLQIVGTGRLGQSYGKHLMGISVVSTHTGRPIGSPAAFGREIVKSLGMYPLFLGVLWILWDSRRQGWHDKALSSIVVKERAKGRVDPFTFLRAIFAAR